MAQRPAAGKAAERLYFAYSPVLEPAAFAAWRKSSAFPGFELPEGRVAEAPELDLVFDLPSSRWGGRIAGLTRVAGRSVYGKLYRIRAEDWAAVQDLEGARSGDFVETTVKVNAGGKQVEAIAFTTNPARASTGGEVSEGYAEALARGAEAAGLPREYVNQLKAESMILQRVQATGRELGLK
jgi:gamma-glutamylcyclotransferase